ncbi:hypothetical protein B0T20DRAFT_467093 [Sordaria brevicollis]|uniref:Uncharacterized protein n=1 Tax=Sordaria brevicollis TaxID=83679 RepID=A0AAE0PLZ7_SORBR|nr:hypothetical protein B0T20DRAFT_467093 [Sordaria brevicollis]
MPPGLPPSHLPLLLHLLIETPASLSFLLRPESQLPLLSYSSSSSSSSTRSSTSRATEITKITQRESTEARLILCNFGGLLLAVNLVVAYLLFGLGGIPDEVKGEVVRGVTGCLSVYHLFPMWRAWKRMKMAKQAPGKGEKGKAVDETEKTLGGPLIHFLVHLLVGMLMGGVGLGLL